MTTFPFQHFCRRIVIIAICFGNAVTNVYAIELIEEIAQAIHTYHFNKPPKSDILNLSISDLNGYLATLDSYSKYLSPSQNRKRKRKNYIGIGAQIVRLQSKKTVLVPYKKGAAFRAGIRSLAILKTINHTPTHIITLPTMKKLFKGEAGSPVKLTVTFVDSNITKTFSVIRRLFKSPSVELIKGSSVPYIRIYKFVEHETESYLAVFLEELVKRGYPLIIDLRFSIGGDFYEALDSASLFVPPNKLLATLVDANSKTPLYSLNRQKIVSDKLLVLVSPITASSAEVFAGALQHYKRGVLIGKKTYGKCTSQSYINLSNGGALLLTRYRLLDPEGEFCEGAGLQPDISVENFLNTELLISR